MPKDVQLSNISQKKKSLAESPKNRFVYPLEGPDPQTKSVPTGPPGWGLGDGLTTRPRKNKLVTETESMETLPQTDQNLTDDPTSGMYEPPEANSSETPGGGKCLLKLKSSTIIGCWNVRTLYHTGKLAQLTKEIQCYNLSVVGICESRWNTFGEVTTATGETFLYSGNPKEEDPHTHGVGILLSKGAAKSLIEWEPISERIITARFTSKGRNITFIQCYAPTNTAVYEEKETFYQQLQAVFQKTPKRDIKIVMGDMNAKIGKDNNDWRGTMGTEGLGQINENGLLFASCCAFNELVIGGSLFTYKQTHKATWISPDHLTENQIDHLAIDRKWRTVLLDVRAKRGTDIDSDHHPLMGEFRMKLVVKKPGNRVQRRFETRKLKNNKICQEWGIHLRNNKWERCKVAFTNTCESVLGYRDLRRKDWVTDATWSEIEARRDIKSKTQQRDRQQQEETPPTRIPRKEQGGL
uniref:Endonuclease/exonuclease/phosphatase domain-containing protein n=1 Tax=Sander lucioperca TaxID=283035 RepID=A0A8D0A351_SANLU